MGLNFPLKLEETRLWMCSKVWTLGILIESTLQNTLIIKHIETLNLVDFFPSSWFFTTGNIKCQESYHAITQITC